MSYQDPGMNPYDPRPTSGQPLVVILGFLLVAVVALGVLLFPIVHRQLLDFDLEYKLREREVTARAEADARFRQREAEFKAEAEALGKKLESVEIAPSIFRAVIAKTGPAVVTISNLMRRELPARRNGRAFDLDFVPVGEGSGVIVRVEDKKTAYIITNAHVVRHPRNESRPADRLGVTFASGRTLHVETDHRVYMDQGSDLAVVVVDVSTMEHLVVAEFADSDKVEAGDWVLAIGNPFGLKQSVSAGIISARAADRVQEDLEMIQTDAAINSGNSGGPLLDMRGRVVGINSAIITASGGSNGVGFAIPANTAKAVFEQLINPPHRVLRGYMGIRMQELSPADAQQLHIEGGAVVSAVMPGSPAERAGLQPTDVIIAVQRGDQRKEVRSAADLRRLIQGAKPDEAVTLEVIRVRGEKVGPTKFLIRLAELPESLEMPMVPQGPPRFRR